MKLTTPLAIRDWIHMRYVLAGIEDLILEIGKPKTLHFGSGRAMTMGSVIGILKMLAGSNLENIEFIWNDRGSRMWEANPGHFHDAKIEEDVREEYEKCVSATSSPISSGGPESPMSSESPEGGAST
jgi:hypothetical protein